MKIHQHKFMEKKIKKNSDNTKSVSYNSEEKIIIITIVLAIVIIGVLLVSLVFFDPAETEKFSAIYYLDSEKQLENIPKTVVLGETITLWVGVENHNGKTLDYQVNLTIRTSPVGDDLVEQTESIEMKEVAEGSIWEFPVEIIIDQPGINEIIFELGFFEEEKWVDTGNWVNLSVEAN